MTNRYPIEITANADPAIDALRRIEGASKRAADSLDLATKVGIGFGVVGPALMGIGRTAIQTADSLTSLTSRLTLVTGSAQAAASVQGELFEIAQSSRVNFVELGNTYATVARSAAAMGISQDRVLRVTESIGQAMALSGGSAQGLQAALTQLSQGLGAGALRGEELNSILEQAPRLAQALADGLGVPIGRLRALGEAGELTTDKVVTALEKAGPQLARELAQATTTVGQAMTVLGNSATRLVGDADKATGATSTLAGAIQGVAKGIDIVSSTIRANEGAFQVLTTAAAGAAGLVAVGAALGGIKLALLGIGMVLAANPVVLTLLGIGAVAGAGVSIYRRQAADAETLKGKLEELARLESATPYRNAGLIDSITGAWDEATNGGRGRAQRIAQLRQEIQAMQASAFASFRAGERDMTPDPGPFPTAKSIDDARKLAKIDLDLRTKYLADRKTLEESFRQAIAKESDPTQRAALERELAQRQRALTEAFNKASAGPATKVPEADRYLESLQKQLLGTRELSAAERALDEIQSGRLGRVTAKQREAILGVAREIDATREAERIAKERADARRAEEKAIADWERDQAEARRRTLDTLLGNTATGRANALRAQLQVLNEEFQAADPSRFVILGEAIRNVEAELAKLEGSAIETADTMSVFADQAARNIQTQLGDSLFQIAKGNFDNIAQAWGDMLLRLVVQAQAARLNEALFGGKGSGGFDLAGLIGSFLGAGRLQVSAPAYTSGGITGGAILPNSLRGGADTGTNELQRDMITLVHKGEAIVPAKYNPARGGSRVTINNYAGAQVETRERDDGGIDIDILARVVEQRMASNVSGGRGPLAGALKARGLNSSNSLARMG